MARHLGRYLSFLSKNPEFSSASEWLLDRRFVNDDGDSVAAGRPAMSVDPPNRRRHGRRLGGRTEMVAKIIWIPRRVGL